MEVTRLKLPYKKFPPQFDEDNIEQWSDYCAVTDVNSNEPDEIVMIDLVLTGLNKSNITKQADVREATQDDIKDIDKGGLPGYL